MDVVIGNGANQFFNTMWVDAIASGIGERFPKTKGNWWNAVLYTVLVGFLGICLKSLLVGMDKFHRFFTSHREYF